MTLRDRFTDELKTSMKAGNAARTSTLRMILAKLKDVDIAIKAAGDVSLPLLKALSREWHDAVRDGHGREDISATFLALGGGAAPA